MNEKDWTYTADELVVAQTSTVNETLVALSKHNSRFVRAMVAGNQYCPIELRTGLANDSSRGVRMWLLGNPTLTKLEFDSMFNTSRDNGYCDVVTPALARSHHADIHQLAQLAHDHT